MSAALRIALREVRERRSLLTAAATFSLLVLALQVAAATRGLAESLTLVLFLAFPTSVALAVGSSLISRDLAQGRLSFYFSRPLSVGTLWGGKFLGGAALVIGAFLCCYLLLFGPATGKNLGPTFVGAWLLLLLCLMEFAHVIATMYRSGSKLFGLDLGLGAVFGALFVAEVRHLLIAGAWRVVLDAIAVGIAVATVAMMAAAAAQLAYGRADAHRGHIALSVTVWTLALAGLGAFALWGGWVLGVTPVDVGGVGGVFAAPRGNALFFDRFAGQGRAGFSPVFLADGQNGSYIRLAPERVTPAAFTADGRMAVWVAPSVPWWGYLAPDHLETALHDVQVGEAVPWVGYRADTLAVARLDGGVPLIEDRPLDRSESWSAALALDSEGRRALLSSRSSAALVDVARGQVVDRIALSGVMAAEFRLDGVVRLYERETGHGRAAFVVLDWNAKDGSRVERARVAGDGRHPMFLLARRGDVAVVSTGPFGKAILDAANATVQSLSSATVDRPGAALVLSTGHVALSLGDELRIVTRQGKTVASVPLEPHSQVYGLREPAPGELAVGLWTLSISKRGTVFLDATTGAVRHEEKEILPAGPRVHSGPAPEPGSLASRLFTDLDGALIALEPDGRRRVIVAGRE